MAIDIMSVQPHKVSRNLRGYTTMFFGSPKSGKTTTATKFPKSLLLAFEIGYLAIPGVKPIPIQKWSEFKQVLKQLKTPEAHEMYETIIIDTADLAFDLCEKYICAREGVEDIGKIPYGGGYRAVQKEFDEALRSIPMMSYGLVLISHAQEKTFTDASGNEYTKISPTLPNKGMLIANRMSDFIVYIDQEEDEEGHVHSIGHLRETPRYIAGSRFQYIVDKILFDYDHYIKAIEDAINEEEKHSGKDAITDKTENAYEEQNELDFDELVDKCQTMIGGLQKSVSPAEFAEKWAPFISSLTDKYLGTGNRIADATPAQVQSLALIVDDLEDALSKN